MTSTSAQEPVPRSNDVCTQSDYNNVRTRHLHLDWVVDWTKRVITGSVCHTMQVASSAVTEASFDASYLLIKRVSDPKTAQDLQFTLAPRHPVLGSKLTVQLAGSRTGEFELLIEYETTPDCTALGWLEAQQTGSGKYPFLYSQCQAIHCRSLLPVQDTPGVKSTYSAVVRSKLPILMSGLRTSPPLSEHLAVDATVERTYVFNQPIAIPSYLIAIAGGEVVFAPLGERTGVWIEPGKLDAAVWEFKKDTENFVATAESLTCPYVWGRYDVLVLPSSFPYGGMENSNLTFLTPALITGDRTEVDTIAHEIAHSWYGNLISVANWDSFWLNEGWTTYTERLVARELHGEPARAFEYIVGNKGLKDELVRHAGHPSYQRLHITYPFGDDPDAAFGSIPYDKGSQFLLHLERTVGGLEVFKPYIKAYVKRFRGLSITTDDWLSHFHQYWNSTDFPEQFEALKSVDFDAWIHGEGLELPVKMVFDTSLADAAYSLAARWDAAQSTQSFPFSKDDFKDFSAKQISLFLDTLVTCAPFSKAAIDALQAAYDLETNGNPEIKLRWYGVALKAGFYAKEAAKWVETAGRMKYCRPTYKAINRVDPELARKTFKESGVHFLHPIARRLVAQDLGLESE